MAGRLSRSPEALEDLEQIAAYIERDSPWYAQAVVQRIVADAESLGGLSLRGRIVPEFGDPALRELFVYRYRLIYRAEAQQILIVAIIHGARELMPLAHRIQDE